MNNNIINEEFTFKTTNKDGLEVLCDTLAVINQDEEPPIIVYTDYTLDRDNKFNVYISKVVGDNENFQLENIDNYENVPEIQQALNKIWNDFK